MQITGQFKSAIPAISPLDSRLLRQREGSEARRIGSEERSAIWNPLRTIVFIMGVSAALWAFVGCLVWLAARAA
jgi:hypothetical protein